MYFILQTIGHQIQNIFDVKIVTNYIMIDKLYWKKCGNKIINFGGFFSGMRYEQMIPIFTKFFNISIYFAQDQTIATGIVSKY